jgi:microcystin-dependent protein
MRLATGTGNVGVGHNVLTALTSGALNTAVGAAAGCNLTTGIRNVVIGVDTEIASPTGSCQLAIGFASGENWLTGDSSKNIIPGAGIKDCAASVGTAGQVLTSTGTALEWRTAPLSADYCAKGVVLAGCAVGAAIPVGPAVSDCYWLMSCDACPGGVTFACIPPFLGDTPVGSVQFFASTVAPTGWLPADGRIISRTSYASLFAVIGTTYGAGDGSTTFQSPDMRGMFPRGWDDAGGTARGCDPGRAFGSTQQDAFELHAHDLRTNTFDVAASYSAPACRSILGLNCVQNSTPTKPNFTPYCTVCDPQVPTQSAVLSAGGTETRPLNVALMPCIKFEVTTAPLTPGGGIPCACITGKGAILTGAAASTPTALPLGTNGQILVADSTCAQGLAWCSSLLTAVNAAVSWRVTAGCLIGGSTNVLTPGVNGVAMVADYNSCGWWSPTTGRFTPTVAGYYQVNYQMGIQNSTGSIVGQLYCNGQAIGNTRSSANAGNAGNATIAGSQVVYMNGSTDYIQLAGASTLNPAALSLTYFSAALTGAITTLPASYQVSQFPTWTTAGTVQAVGISTLANPQPTVGTTSQNQVRYRQIGPKEWEVQAVLYATANSTSAGNGDYLFTLPAGLQFDVSSPFQQPYATVPSEALGWTAYALANGWATVSRNGAGAYQQSMILPYDATRYRIILIGPNVQFWSSSYYQLGAGTPSYYKWGFTFTTP